MNSRPNNTSTIIVVVFTITGIFLITGAFADEDNERTIDDDLQFETTVVPPVTLLSTQGSTKVPEVSTKGGTAGGGGSGNDSGGPRGGGGQSVWAVHWALFMGVLIFIAVAIVLTLACCLCLKLCRKKKGGFPQPETIVTDEPARLTAYAPVHQAMSEDANGLGGPLPVDEESGWIIPLDQMTPEELDQTEVALSKV